MRILVLSDFIDNNINFPLMVEKEAIDMIITLGDLNPNALQNLKEINIPKIGVYGNHCDGKYFEDLGIFNLHLKRAAINGMSFCGYEGSVSRGKALAIEHTQEECLRDLNKMEAVDILISHAPALGVNDDPSDPAHYGFEGIRQFIKEKKPIIYLHGHSYPPEEQYYSHLDKTLVIYVQGAEIIDTDNVPWRSSTPNAMSYYSEVEIPQEDDIEVAWREPDFDE